MASRQASANLVTIQTIELLPLTPGCLLRNSTCIVWICVAASTVSGCSPEMHGDPVVPVDYVGDRGRISYDELVVSLPVRGTGAPYQNLHVTVAVFLDQTERGSAGAFGVEGVVRQCEPRVGARLVESLTGLGEQSIEATPQLRETVRAEAQAVVNEAMKHWKAGAAYRAEVAVTQMYWTAPTAAALPVGVTTRQAGAGPTITPPTAALRLPPSA